MWIILLDRSSSMAEPFKGEKVFEGRSRSTELNIKIQAAKEALLEHLKGLGSPSVVTIMCFNSETSYVFTGLSTEFAEIKAKLDSITADGGTDIAVALDEAQKYISNIQETKFFRTLIISDGLSDVDAARESAKNLVSRIPMSIDVILIDPTDEGEAVARSIALNGSVTAVTNRTALAEQIENSAATYARELEQSGELLKEAELSAINKNTGDVERLAFTASYPGVVASAKWYSLFVYLHLPSLGHEIEKLLAARTSQLGVIPARSTGQISSPIQRETTLKLVPHMEGLEFNPPILEIKWYEDIQESNFRLRANANLEGKIVLGGVDVYVGSCLVALIPLSIEIRQPDNLSHIDAPKVTTVERFGSIFISYSHKDTEIINACVAAYDALGIKVNIDKERLKSGYNWSNSLQQLIDESDLFQLYWSDASVNSPYVEKEWRYAWDLIERLSKGERFVRPLKWEDPCPKLPNELAHLHFATLNLQTLFNEKESFDASSVQSITIPVPRLSTTVLSTLPSISIEQTLKIRESMVHVVEFLEKVCQLRYYPVATLLVDEFVVKSVRASTTVDLPPVDIALEDEISHLATFLDTVCLDFHVRNFDPENLNRNSFDEKFGHGTILDKTQYQRIQTLCEEGVFSRIVEDRWQNAISKFYSIVPNVKPTKLFSEFALNIFNFALQLVRSRVVPKTYNIRIYPTSHNNLAIERILIDAKIVNLNISYSTSVVEVHGNHTDLIHLLAVIRQTFIELLPRFDARYQMGSPNLQHEDDMCLGVTAVADCVLQALLSPITDTQAKEIKGLTKFYQWTSAIINPRWHNDCTELAGLRFTNFTPNPSLIKYSDEFLKIVTKLLEEGLKNLGDFEFNSGIPLPDATWHKVLAIMPQDKLANLTLGIVASESNSAQINLLRGRFSELIYVLKICSKHFIELITKASQATEPVKQFFINQVPTFGIYSPNNAEETTKKLYTWALKHNIPLSITLPNVAKVLLCLTIQQKLDDDGIKNAGYTGDIAQLKDLFQSCVLVHEHFHAILETGIDSSGLTSASTLDLEGWNKSIPLNESLAVWMELHFARVQNNSYLMSIINDYIQAGNYPEWPYRGAECLEIIYQNQGISAIQAYIDKIRTVPSQAQDEFDDLIVQLK